MGFFSKKTASASAPSAEQARPVSRSGVASALTPAALDNPKTLILSFLHESSKTTGMREFVKNYAFHQQGEHRYLVLVEMKEGCARLPMGVLMARWQLFQLGAMRWAMGKSIPLAGLVCAFPLDKATPLAELREMAQLQWSKDPGPSTQVPSDAVASTAQAAADARRTLPRHRSDAGPETQIEVSDDDAEAAEEFFRLTQPPSQA